MTLLTSVTDSEFIFSPAICTYTLCSGWTDDTTSKFMSAVEKLIEVNPILTGCLVYNSSERSFK